jgi:hypothetical protein
VGWNRALLSRKWLSMEAEFNETAFKEKKMAKVKVMKNLLVICMI